MNLALWIVAGLLAIIFGFAGVGKMVLPKEKIARKEAWVEDWSASAIKTIGALEVLAAVGLILPAALDIAPLLVPLAALGLVLVMVGAFIVHLRRSEAKGMAGTLIYLALAGFVAWGRFGPEFFIA
jgi:uncharacterized membrane protein YphA (DoxX/SURF4 family)